MQPRPRRWWTWAVSALAAVVVLATCLSLLFRVAMERVPGYRHKVEALIAQAVGHPARVGAIALTWRGLEPHLELSEVALLDESDGRPLMQMQLLRLGFDPLRLLRGRRLPDRIELAGLDLRADLDADGRWSLRGFDGGSGKSRDWLPEAARFSRIRLFDCRLALDDPRLPAPLEFRLVQADIGRSGRRYKAEAQLLPAVELARSASLRASLDGDLAQPQTWHGEWTAAVADLAGWPWQATLLAPDLKLAFSDAQLRLDGQIEHGRIVHVQAQGQASRVAALREGKPAAQLNQLRFDVAAEADASGQGWMVQARQLAFAGARGAWPEAGLQVHFSGGQTPAIDAQAAFLRLDDLAPWLLLWRDAPPGLARLQQLRGDLRAVRYQQLPPDPEDRAEPHAYHRIEAQLDQLALDPSDGQPGFAGLSGHLSSDDQQGQLSLRDSKLQLQLPHAFERPLELSALEADLSWQQVGRDWRLSAPQFKWTLASSRGQGRFDLWLPHAAEQSRRLDLAMDFSADDVVALKPYLPRTWGEHTREWLNRALQQGRIAHGHLEIAGPLDDYPFVERPSGRYGLDIDVADARLDYARNWPAAEQLQARLQFRGHGLSLASDSAQIAGLPVEQLQADIADFREAQLRVEGRMSGEAARYYALLRSSPLHTRLAGLLDKTDASGPADLALHLDIPLKTEPLEVYARGQVALNGLELKLSGVEQPVRELRGMVAFGGSGISAETLSGQLYDARLNARIRPEPNAAEGVLSAEFDASADAGDGLIAAFTPAWVRSALGGRAHWALRLPFAGPDSGRLTLNSDLRGLESRLPPPLHKGANDSLPLLIRLEGEGRSPLRVRVEALPSGGDPARLTLRFADAAGGGGTRGAELKLGPGEAPQAAADGLVVNGAPAELDLGAWADFLAAADFKGGEGGGAGSEAQRGLGFRSADLSPQRLRLRGARLAQTHILATPAAGGWSAQLDGAGAQGTVSQSGEGPGSLRVRLQHLAISDFEPAPERLAAQPAGPQGVGARAAFDPNQAPTLDLSCDALTVGGADLGRLALITSRIADGQQTETLRLAGRDMAVDAKGRWRRRQGQSSAELSFAASSAHIGTVLQAFGYAQTMDAKETRIEGQLAWPTEPDGLELAKAQGELRLEVHNGTLKSVEPGAGRVLGLLNLYALPRRLSFDFRDVVSKGMGFDRLAGSFRLAGGQAVTEDLAINGPSLKLEMRGRIGLAAHDYDQRVTVYPDVSTGVTVGATLLGGPIAGGIALVAQQLFGKPFNQLGQFSYHVTGSWDNPQIRRGGEQPPAPASERGSG